jgi:gamma-glutamyltranspeptidase/glutathione hydrolase
LEAVVAGVLVAAAESASVLLGPLQLLVGGPGAGLRAVDGRVRQPGLAVPRPRGLQAGEPVPDSARVGVPALPSAIASMLASLGSVSLQRLAGPAIEYARERSAERGRLLEGFARRGAALLLDQAIASELTAAAGRAAGGLLTRKDLASVRPAIVSCHEGSLASTGFLLVPWRSAASLDGSSTQVVAAADASGLVAIACYEASLDGLAIPALGLIAPAFASPVMRGKPRVRPGVPCSAAAPIALRALGGAADLAIGVAAALDADPSLDAILGAVAGASSIGAVLGAAPSGLPVAVSRAGTASRVVAST